MAINPRIKPSASLGKKRGPARNVKEHAEIIGNESLYSDDAPVFGKAFTAEATVQRQQEVIKILWRASMREERAGNLQLAQAYGNLGDKLNGCRPNHRCGSLGCPMCSRANQKAKVVAQEAAINRLSKQRIEKTLVFVTLIPKGMMFLPGKFSDLDFGKANRWLKDQLRKIGIKRPIIGSTDLGWEKRRDEEKYLQLHWHLAMWTSNPEKLGERLKAVFQRTQKYERPVDVQASKDNGFLPYLNKVIKWPSLLRNNRSNLAELLLQLDSTPPLDLLVISRLRLGAQAGGIILNDL